MPKSDFQSQFSTSKIIQIFLIFFSLKNTNLERFLHKNQHAERKLLNFENWVNGEVSKVPQFDQNLTFKVNFKNYPIRSQFFFIKKYQFRSTFFVIDIF